MVSKPSARIVAGLTLVVTLAAALRWHQIAAMPLWLDEVIS